jgi:hypothetical protein
MNMRLRRIKVRTKRLLLRKALSLSPRATRAIIFPKDRHDAIVLVWLAIILGMAAYAVVHTTTNGLHPVNIGFLREL